MFAPEPCIRKMPGLRGLTVVLFLLITFRLNGQEPDPFASHQMVMLSNPAMSGSGGQGTIQLSYLNYFPGNGYDLHSMYLSYDSYFQELHGGVSAFLTENYLGGTVNEISGGAAYSYFLQAGEDLYINAGLSASLFHRGFRFNNSVLPDQIDPLRGVVYPSSEALANTGRTVLDLATGFTVTGKWYSGGFAVSHLAEPDMGLSSSYREVVRRKLFVHLGGYFPVGKDSKFSLLPLSFMSYQAGHIVGGGGLSVENKHIALNSFCIGKNTGDMDLQAGFSLIAGRIRLSYAYRFNVISGSSYMPLSVFHHTGLAFSLNNVDKRKMLKTINFPKM